MSHFDLLRALEPGEENFSQPEEAVLDYLDKLLNTRQGMVAHEPEFGLPDINRILMTLPDSSRTLAKAIDEVIKEYEPRLKNAEVQQQGRDIETIYRIKGVLSATKRVFKTKVDTQGAITRRD